MGQTKLNCFIFIINKFDGQLAKMHNSKNLCDMLSPKIPIMCAYAGNVPPFCHTLEVIVYRSVKI